MTSLTVPSCPACSLVEKRLCLFLLTIVFYGNGFWWKENAVPITISTMYCHTYLHDFPIL